MRLPLCDTSTTRQGFFDFLPRSQALKLVLEYSGNWCRGFGARWCKGCDHATVEFELRSLEARWGVSEYESICGYVPLYRSSFPTDGVAHWKSICSEKIASTALNSQIFEQRQAISANEFCRAISRVPASSYIGLVGVPEFKDGSDGK